MVGNIPEWKTWPLERLLEFVESKGSYRKAAKALGMDSPSSLHDQIKRLKARRGGQVGQGSFGGTGGVGWGARGNAVIQLAPPPIPADFRLKESYSPFASDEQFYEALIEMFGTALQLGSEALFRLIQDGGRNAKEQVVAITTLADKLQQYRAELAVLQQREAAAELRSQVAEVRAALRERFKAVKSRAVG